MEANVFPAGKTNLLYSSASRAFSLPKPCTAPTGQSNFDRTWAKYVALPGSSRTHLAESYEVQCVESGTEQTKLQSMVVVYSADVAGAGGSVWTKTFNDRWLDAFQGVDTDGDGTLDALALLMPLAVTGGYNEQVVILNQTTGAIVSTASYAGERRVP